MAVLTQQQRNTLESAVKQARRISEAGAWNALRAFAVDNPEPFPHMNPEQRSLRNRLRSKARLLGDELPSSGHQQIDQLSYELAYEYWHKMLFAKFLEANGLLMHPDGVSVTMEECEELAKEEGYPDKWNIAASFASKMLPAIFRPEDPLMQISFSPDDRIKLEEILEGLDNYIFTADDALGWVYQFWQSEVKDSINKGGEKIDGEKLPTITQLFTEPYMVHFLIDNTIGAWWVSRNPGLKTPINFEYLRLLEDGSPAAGKFEGWPDKTAEVTSLDPCMGSGHFLVSLFMVFSKLRMYEEELSKEEVTDKVLTENLYGLELDARCTQIAAFNLALTAWKFCGKYKELPQMNLACSGLAPKGKKEDWVKLVGKVDRIDDKTRMENGMAMLYDHFQLAPQLGSLLDPTTIKADLHTASFDQLYPALNNALQYETDKDILERGVIASGIAKAGLILSHKFSLQITNVPYLGRGRLDEKGILSKYCANKFPKSKGDIANVFMERMLINTEGTVCTVMPQNWLFLSTYKNHREDMLKNKRWNFIARLGHGGFSQISGEVVKAILIGISKQKPLEGNNIMGIDVSDITDVDAKSLALKTIPGMLVNQTSQMNNPGFIISFEYKLKEDETRLNKLIDFHKGICTGDRNRFVRFFFELDFSDNWSCFRSTSAHRENIFSGASEIIYWQDGDGDFIDFLHDRLGESIGAWLRGEDAWNKKGITISRVNTGNVTIYCGELFDDNISVLTPKHVEDLPALFCFIRSEEFLRKLKSLNQKLSVDNEYFASISIDIKKWKEIGQKVYPDGLPDIESDITTEYYYHGHPCFADYRLQAAIARLLGYRWPAEKDTKIGLTSRAQDLILNIKKYDQLSDKDGIICLPSVNTEETAANRLRDFLKEVFGGEWNNKTIQQLIEKENSKSANLENWLRNEFFVQHCKVFINRPFIWHIWDGRSDGFSALVNYHKLNKENLSKLIYTYLGDWIRMCESKKKSGESGAEGLLSAAQKLKEKLELILEGEKPYDIFIRWKPLEQQPIGWDPDLNDGVRLNIRPFIEADVLRKKPNIKWGIDRGKNPKGSPWGEIRDNDRHLTLAEKRAAREKLHL